jgi:hypothetical protein
MQGIQHLFRQHAIEKQTSVDSWHSAPYANGRTGITETNVDLKPALWNQGLLSFSVRFLQ